MKLENNGRSSQGKRTRHINIRFFFVTDRIAHGDLAVKYCPTDMLIADFYTKPLQGKLFRLFRNLILNIEDSPSNNFQAALVKLKQEPSSSHIKKTTLKECVELSGYADKENMSANILRAPENIKSKKSYLDVCRSTCKSSLRGNDTRNTVYHQHPALLLKLRDVAKTSHSRKI